MADIIDMNQWYTPSEAAERLSKNSGKPVEVSYVRTLAKYGKVRSLPISSRMRLYSREDVDGYIVEERGEKSARALRQRAKPKTKKRQSKEQESQV